MFGKSFGCFEKSLGCHCLGSTGKPLDAAALKDHEANQEKQKSSWQTCMGRSQQLRNGTATAQDDKLESIAIDADTPEHVGHDSQSHELREVMTRLKNLEKENLDLQARNAELQETRGAKVQEDENGSDDDDRSTSESDGGASSTMLDFVPGLVRGKVRHSLDILEGSAVRFATPWKVLTYLIAVGGVVFVLVAPSYDWGKPKHRRLGMSSVRDPLEQYESGALDLDGWTAPSYDHIDRWEDRSRWDDTEGRRLGGGGGGGGGSSGNVAFDGHQLIINIGYCTVSAGLIALCVHIFDQPLLLGYLLGGVLVGPIGLGLIKSSTDIKTISEFGLILLLFMIGLELDLSELLKMGKVVIVTGSVQFPLCLMVHLGIFSILNAVGMDFGKGDYAVLYVAGCCAISSTMIVVKLLGQKMETDSAAGRLTIGILIFQDMWAIICMSIQPKLDNPDILGILEKFGMMFLLLIIAFTYAKFILPAVFLSASTSMEMLLVLSLAWCFFCCCIALLPWFNLSMELAALIAGVSMATFPYSAELNGKIKYIRDYFITLYFVSLGMQIPTPTFTAIWSAIVIGTIVLIIRWLGMFTIIELIECDNRLAVIATMNLSEVSEFGLVLCSLGLGFGHVENDTLTLMIWTFSILAVGASYFIKYNTAAYKFLDQPLTRLLSRCARGAGEKEDQRREQLLKLEISQLEKMARQLEVGEDGIDSASRNRDQSDRKEALVEMLIEAEREHVHRDVVILGFGRIASALLPEVQDRCPALMKRMHVISSKHEYRQRIIDRGVSFAFGDIGVRDVLEHTMPHGCIPELILITQTDRELKTYTNERLLRTVREMYPDAKIICTAEHQKEVDELYKDIGENQRGADFVLKTVKLSAERLADMLEQFANHLGAGQFDRNAVRERAESNLAELMAEYVSRDKAHTRRSSEIINDTQKRTKKALR